MPAEIREAMKKQRPKERNRNIAVVEEGFRRSASSVPESERNNPSPEHLGIPNVPKRLNGKKCEGEISESYTSDESSGSQSLSPPAPARRKPKASSIASRAAYWDQRVSQGLSSGSQFSPGDDIPDFTWLETEDLFSWSVPRSSRKHAVILRMKIENAHCMSFHGFVLKLKEAAYLPRLINFIVSAPSNPDLSLHLFNNFFVPW